MDITNIDRVPAFTTKDGSQIRELLAHRNSCIRRQSLAEARLPPAGATTPHFHPETEEIYYILEGSGSMRNRIQRPWGNCGRQRRYCLVCATRQRLSTNYLRECVR